jgi:hypothetical protein
MIAPGGINAGATRGSRRRDVQMDDFDFGDFWKDSDRARATYVEEPLTDVMVRAVEQELGYRLPPAYLALMRSQNGGIPKRTCFPTQIATTWSASHIAITGFLGVGRTKRSSLLGSGGTRFMLSDWGYPDIGIYICDCPSAGHDIVMLDYRACGPFGQPAVVHVDQEVGYRITVLAPNFETFVRGLVDASVYDTSAEDLKAALHTIEHGRFSTQLTRLLAHLQAPVGSEKVMRRLLHAIATEKGYFALHDDPLSYLAYDFQFLLFSLAGKVRKPKEYLDAYEHLLAFGDGDVSTRGYAEAFIEEWLMARIKRGEIIRRDGSLVVSDAHRAAMDTELARFR